jgi:hypothetical protein
VHRRRLLWVSAFLLVSGAPARAQEQVCMAVVPAFHDRLHPSGEGSLLRLQSQHFVLFVYRNAVVVYSQADFVNAGTDTLTQEVALPSTGHDENGEEPGGRISNGISSVQVWVEGERVFPEVIHENNEEWYAVQASFPPGEHRIVKALFWAQTTLAGIDSLPGLDTATIAPGKRGFMVDLYHATAWNGVIASISLAAVLKDGLSFSRDSFSAEPDSYELQDSLLSWSFEDVEPLPWDNVVVAYSPTDGVEKGTNTMAKLSSFIVKQVYDELREYAERDEEQ